MATPIKAVPILTGQAAVDFNRMADENESKGNPQLSQSEKDNLNKILMRSKEFKFPWQ